MNETQNMFMNEHVITALITGGFMLMMVIINEIMFLFREKQIRKKEFFNQFFTERIKSHEEIMRIMTKSGFADIDPKRDSESVIKKSIESLCNAADEASVRGCLFVDKYIGGLLVDLIDIGNKTRKQVPMAPELKQECEFTKSVARFNKLYYELLGELREKSGVDLIEDVFESIPKTRDKSTKSDNKKGKKINKENN